jgi:hypothetical protein
VRDLLASESVRPIQLGWLRSIGTGRPLPSECGGLSWVVAGVARNSEEGNRRHSTDAETQATPAFASRMEVRATVHRILLRAAITACTRLRTPNFLKSCVR